MDQLAGAAAPILKLRGSWTVIDPAIARKARKRLVRTVKPAQAVAAALTGVVQVDPAPEDGPEEDVPVVVGASLLKVRDQLPHRRDPRADRAARRPAGDPARLPAARLHLAGRDDLARPRRLPGRRHGPGQDGHPDRAPPAPASRPAPSGPTLVVCPASLLGNWEDEVRRFAPGVPVRRFHGGAAVAVRRRRRVRADDVRHDAARPRGARRASRWDIVVADEAQHVKNARSSTARALRSIPSRARVALTGTPVENNLTELWSILDWATPGLLGSRNAFRKVWAAPIESGLVPSKARAVPGADRPVPAAPAQVRPRHRARAAGQDRDRPPAPADPRAGGALRGVRARHHGPDRARRRGRPARAGAGAAHRAQADLQPPRALPEAVRAAGSRAGRRSSTCSTRCSGRSSPRTARCWSSPSTSPWPGCSRRTSRAPAYPTSSCTAAPPSASASRWWRGSRPARCRCSCCRSRPAAPASTSPAADHVVHVDRWWNPAVEEQATDRAYRIGQTKPVQVHRLITTGTIEERIAELLSRKRALADSVLARGETALTELSDAELRDLVTLRRQPRGGRRRRDGRAAPPGRRPAGSAARARTWWGKAWVRAVEEAAYAEARPAPARAAWPGPAGSAAITVDDGSFLAAVGRRRRGVDRQRRPARARRRRRPRRWSRRWPRSRAGWRRCWPATCRSPWSSTPRRPASSCCPTAASSRPTCTCAAWADPCPHALAVLYQLAWLVEDDPLVLLPAARAGPRPAARPAARRRRRRVRVGARTTTSTRGWTPHCGQRGCWSCSSGRGSRSTTCSEPPRAELARTGQQRLRPERGLTRRC